MAAVELVRLVEKDPQRGFWLVVVVVALMSAVLTYFGLVRLEVSGC